MLYYGAEAIKNLTEAADREATEKKAEEERLAAKAEAKKIAEEARKVGLGGGWHPKLLPFGCVIANMMLFARRFAPWHRRMRFMLTSL